MGRGKGGGAWRHAFDAADPAASRAIYCLISCLVGAWHYRIFPDFLNCGLKMASKIEGKAKVIACS